MDMQRDFLRFWIDRVYYHDPRQIVSFIKGDENLFRARMSNPAFYGAGAGMMAVYIVVLLAISYICFGTFFWGRGKPVGQEETRQLSELDIDLKGGMIKVWLALGPALVSMLYDLFSGNPRHLVKRGFKGKVRWEGKDMIQEPQPVDFFYMCRREEFPGDMKVQDLQSLDAALNRLTPGERRALAGREEILAIYEQPLARLKNREFFEVQLALLGMRKRKVYVINDIAADVPIDSAGRLLDRMKELAAAGALVVYLTGTGMEPPDEGREDRCWDDGEEWLYRVEARRRSRSNQKNNPREDGSRLP